GFVGDVFHPWTLALHPWAPREGKHPTTLPDCQGTETAGTGSTAGPGPLPPQLVGRGRAGGADLLDGDRGHQVAEGRRVFQAGTGAPVMPRIEHRHSVSLGLSQTDRNRPMRSRLSARITLAGSASPSSARRARTRPVTTPQSGSLTWSSTSRASTCGQTSASD